MQDMMDLVKAMQEHGITSIIGEFDGYGDSGGIENIAFMQGDKQIDDPDPDLEEMAENAIYDILETRHLGWEDGDGAFGTVTIHQDGKTNLVINSRFTDYITEEEEFTLGN